MKKFMVFILMAGILFACSPTSLSADFNGEYIYVAIDAAGQPTGTLIVANIQGEEITQVQLPKIAGRYWINLYPTRASGIVIALRHSIDTFLDETYWINIGSGEVKLLDFEGNTYSLGELIGSTRRRFAVFNHTLTGLGDQRLKLIDLQTGALTDLNDINEAFLETRHGTFSPDESHLVLNEKGSLWLIPSEDPNAHQEIGDSYGGVFFSSDGKKICYCSKEEGIYAVNIYLLAENSSETFLSSSEFITVEGFVPNNNDQVFVSSKESLSLLNINSGEEIELLQDFGIFSLVPSASENELLVHVDHMFTENAARGYSTYLMELDTFDIELLDKLNGLSLYDREVAPPAACVYFVDDLFSATQVKSFSFETRKIQDILNLNEELTHFSIQTFSSENAKSAFIWGLSQYALNAWGVNCEKDLLIDLEAEKVGWTSIGQVSPDNAWEIYDMRDPDTELQMITLLNMITGEKTLMAPGMSPVWLVE